MTFITGFVLCFFVIFCASVPPLYRRIDGSEMGGRVMGALMILGIALAIVGLLAEAVEFFL